MKPIMRELHARKAPKGMAMLTDYKHRYVFEWRTITGVIEIKRKTLLLVFVENIQPHNGQFEAFIDFIENSVAVAGLFFYVGPFINSRLLGWFLSRGYHFKPHRELAIYDAKLRAVYPDGMIEIIKSLVDSRMEEMMALAKKLAEA